MQHNKLTIIINRPTQEVFDFTLNPENTPKWIDEIELEETNEWPAKVGTIYRNKSMSGVWAQYKLTELVEDKSFTLVSNQDANFTARYGFTKLDDQTTDFEYYEWVDQGTISEPFEYGRLEKLKRILEQPRLVSF